jgi:hypothetical protein
MIAEKGAALILNEAGNGHGRRQMDSRGTSI